MEHSPATDHPRPLLRREWASLDGTWEFAFDREASAVHPQEVDFDRTITVPFAPETPASGIGESEDGALIDADSCARMAVAGYDAETEIRLGNCAELLEASGDCVTIERATPQAGEALRYLVLGIKWHAPAGH